MHFHSDVDFTMDSVFCVGCNIIMERNCFWQGKETSMDVLFNTAEYVSFMETIFQQFYLCLGVKCLPLVDVLFFVK